VSYGDGQVLDIRQVDKLAVELDSRTYAVGFVGRFLEGLPDRLATIHRTLLEGKSEGALVAILSVATSAAMAGAIQLERHSREIEQSIRAGDLESARDAARTLDSNVADFAQQATLLLSAGQPA
jgi:HPt (histidine-containing phosphotransfer) domain-containing protein